VAKRLAKYDVLALPLKHIYYDADFNCRGQFVLESVSELADSIRCKGEGVELQGLDFPVVVQPAADVEGGLPEGFDYRLLAGHRRYRAVEFYLKWKKIPAMVRKGLSDYDARLINLTENLEREDLNMWQEAVAIQRLYPDGVTLRRAHDELHRPTKWIAARLRLLKLRPEVQQQAAAGLLSAAFIEQLGKDASEEDQLFLSNQVAKARNKSGQLPGLPSTYKRKFKDRRSKEQIGKMIAKLFNAGISGLPCRVLAWAAGGVSDEEIDKDISSAQNGRPFYDSLSGDSDDAGTTDAGRGPGSPKEAAGN
jgi:ParB/RepB/Spo0J family partition protein